MKAQIVTNFHRFHAEPGKRERKESLIKGMTVIEGQNGVTSDDIADWIAKGLAKPVDPLDHDGDGRRGGSLPRTPKAAE